ncbi:MAG TPA: hypothetical protein VN635_14750 [Conexibacter sp.]|nr:hypothetical protein [Conexibacter sp.]
MSGNAYKVLGFLVWRGGIWYLRRRYRFARGAAARTLAAAAVAAAGAAVAAQRRHAASKA